MKVGVISDTHDRLSAFRRAITMFERLKVQAVFHADDCGAPFAARLIAPDVLTVPLYCVYGNNDGERAGLQGPAAQPGRWPADDVSARRPCCPLERRKKEADHHRPCATARQAFANHRTDGAGWPVRRCGNARTVTVSKRGGGIGFPGAHGSRHRTVRCGGARTVQPGPRIQTPVAQLRTCGARRGAPAAKYVAAQTLFVDRLRDANHLLVLRL